MVANATAEMKPNRAGPPTALARWIAGMLAPPLRPAAAVKLPFQLVANSGLVPTSTMAPKPMMKVRM